jgi:hypothetical protein
MVELDDGLAQAIRGAVRARREDAVNLLQELVRSLLLRATRVLWGR